MDAKLRVIHWRPTVNLNGHCGDCRPAPKYVSWTRRLSLSNGWSYYGILSPGANWCIKADPTYFGANPREGKFRAAGCWSPSSKNQMSEGNQTSGGAGMHWKLVELLHRWALGEYTGKECKNASLFETPGRQVSCCWGSLKGLLGSVGIQCLQGWTVQTWQAWDNNRWIKEPSESWTDAGSIREGTQERFPKTQGKTLLDRNTESINSFPHSPGMIELDDALEDKTIKAIPTWKSNRALAWMQAQQMPQSPHGPL